MARWLYENNDIERSYNYIQQALNDANFYNTRTRNFQFSKIAPIINKAYQQKAREQRRFLIIILTCISSLFISLLVFLFFLKRQMRELQNTQQALKVTNKNLGQKNEELNSFNRKLHEANLLKEEYIGNFIDLSSRYISKLQEFRKSVYNKIAAKQFDDLMKITSSAKVKDEDIQELYTNFDRAFLSIYPSFVSCFNQLLKKEEQIELKRGELLNTELRVFALIRLGITDSSKIAHFLRCSLQTVYNYRSKIRKKSVDTNADMEELIKKIGIPEGA